MSARTAIAGLLLGLAGCASIPRLVARPQQAGREDALVSAAGVQLRAVPNAWKGPPPAVSENFTPIFVHVINQGDQTYDITYGAFTLIDETGRIYSVVPPMEVVRATVGAVTVDTGERLAMADDGSPEQQELLAQVGFGFGFGPYDPFYDPYYGPAAPYGPSPYGYGYADAARSIVVQGLREGRLMPKTQAMGFLYFQRAYDAKELRLRLEAPSEAAGTPALVLEASFAVQH